MTTATLIKKTFNWGGSLTVSEVQSIIIMNREHGGMQWHAGRHGAETESSASCRQQEVN